MVGLVCIEIRERGIDIESWAYTPDLFQSVLGTGTIEFTQLATDFVSWTDATGVVHSLNRNGVEGLDDGGLNNWASYGISTTADGSWNAGFMTIGDSPTLQLALLPRVVSATRNFSASTWVMYSPPGLDSTWVPLWKIGWGFTSSASGPEPVGNPPSFTPWGAASGSASGTGKQWLPSFPQWGFVLSQHGGYNP